MTLFSPFVLDEGESRYMVDKKSMEDEKVLELCNVCMLQLLQYIQCYGKMLKILQELVFIKKLTKSILITILG